MDARLAGSGEITTESGNDGETEHAHFLSGVANYGDFEAPVNTYRAGFGQGTTRRLSKFGRDMAL